MPGVASPWTASSAAISAKPDTHERLTATTGLVATPEDSLHRALLALHKAVLAAERENLERVHGSLSSAAFLQIVSDPVRYGWLKPFSELILAFEEDEDERAPAEELRERTRDLLLPPSQKTPFGRRYLSLMQREPGLVLAHAELAKLLRREEKEKRGKRN